MQRILLPLLFVFHLSWVLWPSCVAMAQQQPKPRPPDPTIYQPHYFQHVQEPFTIRLYGYYRWRDGANSRPNIPTPLPPECWAISYWFVWSGESDYDGTGRHLREDPEPVIIFVSDNGQIVGMQTRAHGIWLPIVPPPPQDIAFGTHVIVGFLPMPNPNPMDPRKLFFTHTPMCGAAAIAALNVLGGAKEMGCGYPLTPVARQQYPL